MFVREADVCVVGAGAVGLAHALEARRRGLRVIVLERDQRAVGASVRNFGHVFTSALGDGEPLEVGRMANVRWRELGEQTELGLVEGGSLILARAGDELAVLEEFAADPAREARVLTAPEAKQLAPLAEDDLAGALFCPHDVRVDPRRAVAALAALLEQDAGAEIVWGAQVHAVSSGVVASSRGEVHAPLAVVCPGPELTRLPVGLQLSRSPIRLCRLQMLRVACAVQVRPALLTGLSLLRYPAFSQRAATAAVRERLSVERPELLAAGIHLIVTQLPGGDLIIGDTHDYDEPPAPFSDERLDRLLLAEAARVIGRELAVRERWQGVYPVCDGEPFLVESPLPGVWVVAVVSGIGMTTGLGLAERFFERYAA